MQYTRKNPIYFDNKARSPEFRNVNIFQNALKVL